jgi:hypothetical protein
MQATLALRFGGEGILKIKGIPFRATATEVRKFFQGFKIKPAGVNFVMHVDGRPTGMAFVVFESPQEAVLAMSRDRAIFSPEYGDRFCILQPVGHHEMVKSMLQKEVVEAAAAAAAAAMRGGGGGGCAATSSGQSSSAGSSTAGRESGSRGSSLELHGCKGGGGGGGQSVLPLGGGRGPVLQGDGSGGGLHPSSGAHPVLVGSLYCGAVVLEL